MFTKTLYGYDLNKRLREWTIEVEKNGYRTTSGLVDGEKVTSAWSYAFGKNLGRANATTDEEQAMRVAETLIRVRKELGYAESPEEAAKGKAYFQPMLAAKWNDVKSKVNYPVFVQTKLDGIRLILTKDGMFSRNGKEILSAPHIYEAVKQSGIFEQYPDIILDGELYCHDLNEDFNKIISLVRKTKPTAADLEESKKYIQYWIYDVPSYPDCNTQRDEFRNSLFNMFIRGNEWEKYFHFVESVTCHNEAEVDAQLEKNLAEGYEGAIIRLPGGMYENRRSKNLLKYKKFLDEEFLIDDFEEGRGNLAGKVGRVICHTKEGKRFAAGMKFSHDEAKSLWENKDQFVGKKLVSVKFFEWTPDGLPRFPKAIAIRDYE